MLNESAYSSKSAEWSTPQWLFDQLDEEFGFTLDACAQEHNAKCSTYYSPEQDGLVQEWQGTVWCNPPYGRTIKQWVKKAYESSLAGATVVCLLPARVDTAWFHDYCFRHGEVRFLRGRLQFEGSDNMAPFPSVVVIFRPVAVEKAA